MRRIVKYSLIFVTLIAISACDSKDVAKEMLNQKIQKYEQQIKILEKENQELRDRLDKKKNNISKMFN